MDLTDVALLVVAGLAAGAVNSVAGGGSLITFPALLATGLGSVAANVTNSVAICAGYVSAAAGTREEFRALARRQSDPATPGGMGRPTLRALFGTAALGTAAGCALLLGTPEALFTWAVPFLVLGATAVLAFQQRLREVVGHPHELSRRRQLVTLHASVALGSVYGGYFGAALGVILIALIGLVLDETIARVTALKNSLAVVIGLVTVVVFAIFGPLSGNPVDWTAVAVLTPATLVGGYAGARAGRRLQPAVLRGVIVVFGTAVGLVLLWRAISP
jgi:uncharacterized membrane protein YfcA